MHPYGGIIQITTTDFAPSFRFRVCCTFLANRFTELPYTLGRSGMCAYVFLCGGEVGTHPPESRKFNSCRTTHIRIHELIEHPITHAPFWGLFIREEAFSLALIFESHINHVHLCKNRKTTRYNETIHKHKTILIYEKKNIFFKLGRHNE